MTNHWNDIQWTDCALIIGGNPAENHPISMKFIQMAKERGGKVISVDPRYTRTSQLADVYAPMRSGTDIAFIGGLLHYAMENDLYHQEYVANYTNASFILSEDFDFNDGLFSGYNDDTRSYDKSTWTFQKDEEGNTLKDLTLKHPRCVFQIMKKHYSRYDVETVSSVTGTPKEDFLKVAKTFCATGKADKAGTIMYAMGTTQHTVGSQNVRSYAMLQLLLGNVGKQGGGVNAMRGECNVQGSTDMALLFHILPGYLPAPAAGAAHKNLEAYNATTPASGYWSNRPKFMASLLKAFYGKSATPENDFLYDYLPKYSRNSSHISLFEALYEGDIKGMLVWGQNPVVGGPNSNKEKKAMENLDWLVAIDLWETETAAFWKPEAGNDPAKINTEVFMLPACGPYEKEGAVTNSGRWKQFRWKAIEPKHESKADVWICHNLARRVKDLYKGDSSTKGKIINALDWSYGDSDYPSNDLINREINGYDLTTGKTVLNFTKLKDDGTTSSGNWIYSGVFPDAAPNEDKNLAKRRDVSDPGGMENYLSWSFAWPVNRRILYNRAGAGLNGKPWDPKRPGIHWDGTTWANGNDVPDFAATKAPTDPGGNDPFIMRPAGHGELFSSMADGPLPEHYEPYESPVPNAFSSVELNPAVKIWSGKGNDKGDKANFPIVVTTYRLTEHWQSGSMSRNLEWLSELSGHMFVEMSEDLAQEKGIKNKDKVVISSARGEIEAYAMITKRFKPYTIRGEKVHHIGMPWHWGYMGITTGGIANTLTPHIGDANTMIPEYKAFLGNVRRAD